MINQAEDLRRRLEGGKVFRCQRCGRVLWRTSAGWHDLGHGQDDD